MAAVDWSGYEGDWHFADWAGITVTVYARPASGHVPTDLAENLACNATGEKSGMQAAGGTVHAAYTRRFYFADTYKDGHGNARRPRAHGGVDLLAVGRIFKDETGTDWTVMAASNPGAAEEHWEIDAVRRVT